MRAKTSWARHSYPALAVPLRREEPVIEKEARVREEIRARKTTGTEQRTVSGEVRKEDVEVEKQRKAA